MDDKDRKIAALESQIVILGSRINQFYKLFSYTTLVQFEKDPAMTDEVRENLKKVISGKAVVKHWKILPGHPIEPVLVED